MVTCEKCSYRGASAFDGQCPECRHREITARLEAGTYVTVSADFPGRYHGQRVELLTLHRNGDGRCNGIARIRPLRVCTGHHCGEPVYRDGTDNDVVDIGTRALMLGCGKHSTDYPCDCDTIEAEAASQG